MPLILNLALISLLIGRDKQSDLLAERRDIEDLGEPLVGT